MTKKLLFTLLFVCCLTTARAQPPADADKLDDQCRSETQVVFPLVKETDAAGETTDKLTFKINGNLRFGDDISRPVDERVGFGFGYRINKFLSIEPAYLYVAQPPERGAHQYECRLRLAANLEKKWDWLSLDDRNLMEIRFRNSRSDSARYRNRLRFRFPIKKGEKELFTPYATNEITMILGERFSHATSFPPA